LKAFRVKGLLVGPEIDAERALEGGGVLQNCE